MFEFFRTAAEVIGALMVVGTLMTALAVYVNWEDDPEEGV